MKPRHQLTIASLALVTAVSSGLVAPGVQARGYGHYDRFDRQHYPIYPGPRAGYFRPGRRGYFRPYYGAPYATDRAYKTMGVTAVTLGLLDLLNAEQQRRHEMALIGAVSRPGEVIVWDSGGAVGTVETIRTGVSSSGRQCREYQQTVTVGRRTEQAYGTACLQPDGDWEIIGPR